eukprot:jgi/Chrpa1/20387/Chrysochromulina_OHIO_Genome00006824-RA
MADTVSSIQKVRDYITKYGIEEKLSEAVNQAIKQESTDPFRVISMYLAQFAEVANGEVADAAPAAGAPQPEADAPPTESDAPPPEETPVS